jgi:LuxR family transcriptional regulator, maltose regulon positive regulatory protein
MAEEAAYLVSTKLFVPHPRQSLVMRMGLLTRLDQCFNHALTLVCAPAGYGKTTLLTSWIENMRVPTTVSSTLTSSDLKNYSWVSLDAEDDDPLRFLSYLTASLEDMQPGIFEIVQPYLNTFPSPPLPSILTLLINNLNRLSSPVVLILDDYQFISNATIHDSILFILDHLPPNLHLLIATRSDPPIPLARLRARNQLLEFRAEDLRFRGTEAVEFLNQTMGLPLSLNNIDTLEQRTEGWIAGLQMAAIALRSYLIHGRADINQFIESFSGSHRYILDYLVEEILNRQPPDVVNFLLKTSILDRLSAPLCDAVLGESQPSARDSLDYLDHANLFLISLDDERCWFRYHHLFADLLRARLQQAEPNLVPLLHLRASDWYAQNGWIEEAVIHSKQAKNWDHTAWLVEQNLQSYLEQGQLATILKWVDLLPQELIRQRPKLCIRVAEALAHAGQMDRVELFLETAEAWVHALGSNVAEDDQYLIDMEVNQIRAMAGMLRGYLTVVSGDPARGLAFVQTALREGPNLDSRTRAWLYWSAGFAYQGLGKLRLALDSFIEAARFGKESGMTLRDIWTDLAITTLLLGNLSSARAILDESLKIAADRGSRNQGNLSRDEAYLSAIMLEQNQLEEALIHARKAVEYTQWWPSHNHIAAANAFLARILLACGDLEGSIQVIQLADQERKKGQVTQLGRSVVDRLVDRALVRVWLAQNNWVALEEWEKSMLAFVPSEEEKCGEINEIREMHLILLARVWIEKAKRNKGTSPVEAVNLLTCLEINTRTAERVNALIEVLTLKASGLQMQGIQAKALETLGDCLSLAEPGGYVRTFIDAGEPIRYLLITYLHTPWTLHKEYAQKLLETFTGLSQTAAPGASQSPLVEPLTKREMDVLRLMAAGLSNRQIAETMVIAEGTVKFYVHTVLQKLQVHSRTQAIAAANEHHLI